MRRRLLTIFLLSIAALIAWSQYGVSKVEKNYPPIGEFITINDQRLHYVDLGPRDAPALLLIHGASSNLQDYQASLIPELSKDYRVLAFDRPGLGYSERSTGDWQNPAQVIDLLLTAAETLDASQPVIVGHSFAGSLVMAGLVEYPERISGGVLLAGVVGHWSGSVGWTYDVGKLPVLGPLFAHLLVYPVGQHRLADSSAAVFAPNDVTENYVENLAIPLALRPRNFLYNVEDMTLLSEWLQPFTPRYREIELPLLAIHGEADTLVPFWNHAERLIPVIDHIQIEILPGVGHVPHHAETSKVAMLISDFMAKLPNNRSLVACSSTRKSEQCQQSIQSQ